MFSGSNCLYHRRRRRLASYGVEKGLPFSTYYVCKLDVNIFLLGDVDLTPPPLNRGVRREGSVVLAAAQGGDDASGTLLFSA